ncbi:MAG: KH domain-containing protein [Candidatus Woesearchaeota archaeon]
MANDKPKEPLGDPVIDETLPGGNLNQLSHELKIPRERIAVLIGSEGEMKKRLEENLVVKIDVNSEEGDVFISGNDALKLFNAQEIVKAIGRGFNPEVALKLRKTDFVFELINLKDFFRNKNHITRIKGRIIGTEGKTREIIEEHTGCNLSVYGKTIGIIGRSETAAIARKAIDMIIEGSQHSSVYRFLETKRKELRSLEGRDSEEIADDFKKFA